MSIYFILFTNNKQYFKLHILPNPIRNRFKCSTFSSKKQKQKKTFLHSRLHLVTLHSAFCEKLLLFILHNDFQNVWNFTGIQFVDCTLSSTFIWLPVYSVPPSLWLSAGSALTRPPLPVPGIFWILGGFFSHHYEQIL